MLLYAVDYDDDSTPVAVRHMPSDEVTNRTRRPDGVSRRRFFVRSCPPAWSITGSPANLQSLAAAVTLDAREIVASQLGLGSGPLVVGGVS